MNDLIHGDISKELETMKGLWRNGNANVRLNTEYLRDNIAAEQSIFGGLYNPETNLDKINAVTAENVQGYIQKAMSGPLGIIGLAPEGTFPPEAEFRDIMRLQEPSEAPRLRRDFTA